MRRTFAYFLFGFSVLHIGVSLAQESAPSNGLVIEDVLKRDAVENLIRFYFRNRIAENEKGPQPPRPMALVFIDREYMPGTVLYALDWDPEHPLYFLIDSGEDGVTVTQLDHDEPFSDFIGRLKRICDVPKGKIKGMTGPYGRTYRIYFNEGGSDSIQFSTWDPAQSKDLDALMGIFGYEKPFVDPAEADQ